MKKILILSGIAALCLVGETNVSSAYNSVKSINAKHLKTKKAKLVFDQVNGSYFNSNSFPITVLFMQFGHPQTVLNIPPGYSSGTYSVPAGTYDVQFSSSGPVYYEVTGYANQQGSNVTFPGVTFSSSSPVTFTCDLPQ